MYSDPLYFERLLFIKEKGISWEPPFLFTITHPTQQITLLSLRISFPLSPLWIRSDPLDHLQIIGLVSSPLEQGTEP